MHIVGVLGAVLAYLAWQSKQRGIGKKQAEDRFRREVEHKVAKSEALERETAGMSDDAVLDWLRQHRTRG